MSEPWPRTRLGDVLRRSAEVAKIDPEQQYQEITVRLWGKGVVHRRSVSGAAVAGSRRFAARAGQFILSRIDARNGACGLVPGELSGAVVTNDFPLFDIDRSRLDPAFLEWLGRTRGFVALCQSASEGTTNRVRLQVEHFLASEIRVPQLDVQQRIVAQIEAMAERIAGARGLMCAAECEVRSLTQQMVASAFPRDSNVPVGDVVEFQVGYAFKSEWFTSSGVRLLRNANVGHGTLLWDDSVFLDESRRAEFTRFELRCGDIVVSLDRPLISTGVKAACVRQCDLPALLLQRVARAHVDTSRLDRGYFFWWLRSPLFVSAIDPGRSNGVPHISHKQIEKIPMPLPSLTEQKQIVARLESNARLIDELRAARQSALRACDAMMPAVLRNAFSEGM